MTDANMKRLSPRALEGMKSRTKADAPDGPDLGTEFWRNARIVEPRSKKSVHLRVDADVLDFFREQGRGHLTRMNAVLRAYVDAHR